MKPLNITAFADEEFASSVIYYEEQQAGLGAEFIKEIDATFETIVANPDAFGHFDENVRFKLVQRFSHVIFYQEYPEEIAILSIAHTSRRPSRWKQEGF